MSALGIEDGGNADSRLSRVNRWRPPVEGECLIVFHGLASAKAFAKPLGVILLFLARSGDGDIRHILPTSVGSTGDFLGGVNWPQRQVRFV